jgi:hypothetical protein
MKKILVAFLLLAGMYGCGDEWISITLNVENNTNDTISMYLPIKDYTYVCLPETKQEFYKTDTRIANNFDCNPHIQNESIIITTSSKKKLKKDITDKDNWICNRAKRKGWTMTFVITKNDLE